MVKKSSWAFQLFLGRRKESSRRQIAEKRKMFLAQLSQTNDPTKPSFFEMIAQHTLVSTLRPGFKYLISVLALRDSKWEVILRNFDFIFHSILLVIENHYLEYKNSSFAENFYGLKRVKKTGFLDTNGKPIVRELSKSDKFWSLFFLVLFPYAKIKMDQYYSRRFNSTDSENPINPTTNNIINTTTNNNTTTTTTLTASSPPARIRWLIKLKSMTQALVYYGYPVANGVFEGLHFIYQIFYLYEKGEYFSPFLHLQKIKIARVSMEDLILEDQATNLKRMKIYQNLQGSMSPIKIIALMFIKVWFFILDYSHFILPLALFFFKFLEWWYAENRSPQQSLPTPPPPEAPVLPGQTEGGVSLPTDKTKCPICREERTNPAIVGSGYVFCYPCIFNYVQKHSRCPVSFLPSDVSQIRRLYDQST